MNKKHGLPSCAIAIRLVTRKYRDTWKSVLTVKTVLAKSIGLVSHNGTRVLM